MTHLASRIQWQPGSLLKTKLTVPRVLQAAVLRSRLFERLDKSTTSLLTLVCAPAGFGKTLLLSTWCAILTQEVPSAAWVSLDESDNDSARFWLYVVAALQTLRPELGTELLILLQQPQTPPIRSVLTTLVNILTNTPQNIVLVLDDYHVISEQAIHDDLAFLLEHLPPHVHLVIASRVEPPFSLATLRVQGQLLEIRADDLRFTDTEVVQFFHDSMQLALSAEVIARLEARTEGWAVGLQLAALSLKNEDNEAEALAIFDGTHRFVLDYLTEVVFAQQPQEVQDFLLYTAILDRLNASLCNALTAFDDGQSMLAKLEQANLFIVPLDQKRVWYRYHHLFAEFLYARLQRDRQEMIAPLHWRASQWYEAQGYESEAVEHALAAAQQDKHGYIIVADLIARVAEKVWMRGEVQSLVKWLDALPLDLLRSYPRLCLYRAWTIYSTKRSKEIELWLDYVEEALQAGASKSILQGSSVNEMRGEVCALRAYILYSHNEDTQRTIELCEQARLLLPTYSSWLGIALYILGSVYAYCCNYDKAIETLSEGITVSKATHAISSAIQCYTSLSYMYFECGQLSRVSVICQQALEFIGTSPIAQSLMAGAMHHCLSELYYEWNKLEEAEYYAAECIACGNRSGNEYLILAGEIDLVKIHIAQEKYELASTYVEEKFFLFKHVPYKQPRKTYETLRVQLWLAQGDRESAIRWINDYQLEVEDEQDTLYITERLNVAQVYLLQERFPEVHSLLVQALQASRRNKYVAFTIEVLCLQALLFQAQHDIPRALATLMEALTLGEPEAFVRTIINYGKPMGILLTQVLNGQRRDAVAQPVVSQSYITQLLLALNFSTPETVPSGPSQALSNREAEVLHLIAAGFSDKEIAERLVISGGTVKTHIKRIFSKLNAKSRTQAVAYAREMHML